MFEKFERLENESLCQHSTMKTGGKAKWILFPKNLKELKEILSICKENGIKFFILGNGSNVLFSDGGFDGVIISLKHFNTFKILCEKTDIVYVKVGAGINLFDLNFKLQKQGLSGLEFSFGIPATLGGFLRMNSGCFGHEICEIVEEVYVLDGERCRTIKNKDCGFAYRSSNLEKYIILGAKLRFFKEKCEKIAQNMQFYLNKKKSSQPCEMPSLGSVFKRGNANGEIVFPAKIIDELGLKGFSVGGAQVSLKHAGFIVNSGNATSKDVLALIEFLEEKLKTCGFCPEREIIVLI